MISAAALILLGLVAPAGPCDGAQNQVELVDCLQKQVDDLHRQLQSRVSVIEAGLASPRAQVLFVRSQDAWKLFRDTECESEAYQFEGGTLVPVAQLRCLLRVSAARVEELRNVYPRVR
jgi:uncharacterized protein YecT (DUF1311 family)